MIILFRRADARRDIFDAAPLYSIVIEMLRLFISWLLFTAYNFSLRHSITRHFLLRSLVNTFCLMFRCSSHMADERCPVPLRWMRPIRRRRIKSHFWSPVSMTRISYTDLIHSSISIGDFPSQKPALDDCYYLPRFMLIRRAFHITMAIGRYFYTFSSVVDVSYFDAERISKRPAADDNTVHSASWRRRSHDCRAHLRQINT